MEARDRLQNELIDTLAAKEAVLYANTPSHILKNIRKDSSASYVAQSLTTSEILKTLSDMSVSPIKDIDELVRFYVFLVSLALKEDVNTHYNEARALDLRQIQWGPEILEAILEGQKAVSFTRISLSDEKVIQTSATTTNTSSGIVITGD